MCYLDEHLHLDLLFKVLDLYLLTAYSRKESKEISHLNLSLRFSYFLYLNNLNYPLVSPNFLSYIMFIYLTKICTGTSAQENIDHIFNENLWNVGREDNNKTRGL